MTSCATVSIIIAAYNAEATIERAVMSALDQPEVTKVIVVDDGSQDSTNDAAKRLQLNDNRVQIINLPSNSGPSVARNVALNTCKDEWIGILDADDYFLPGRIAALLAQADHSDLVADDMMLQEEGSKQPNLENLFHGKFSEPTFIDLETFVEANINHEEKKRMEMGFIKPLIRRSFIDDQHIRYMEHLRFGEDYEFYCRCLGLGARLCIIPQAFYVSIIRPHSLSRQFTKYDLIQYRDADYMIIRNLPISKSEKQSLRNHANTIAGLIQWLNLNEAVKEKSFLRILLTFRSPFSVQRYILSKIYKEFIKNRIYKRFIKNKLVGTCKHLFRT